MNRMVLVVLLFFLAGCHLHVGGEPQELQVGVDVEVRSPSSARVTIYANGKLQKGVLYFAPADYVYREQDEAPMIKQVIEEVNPNRLNIFDVELLRPVSNLVFYARGPQAYGWKFYRIREGKMEAMIGKAFSR